MIDLEFGGQINLLFTIIEYDYYCRDKGYKMKRKRILHVVITAGIFFSCSDSNNFDQEFIKAYVTLQGSDKIAAVSYTHLTLPTKA